MAEEIPSTRVRVLRACRQLFNERGPTNATTAEIAAFVGINEGNLYYYFKRKEQILVTLFDEFEEAMEQAATKGLEAPADPARYSGYITGWFQLMWEYRFFYRDGGELFRMAPSLRARVKVLTDRGQQNVRRVLMDMAAHGMLRANAQQIDQLVINSWIVATYWIEYLRSREGVTEITVAEVEWGFSQVKSLFAPYLVVPQRPLSLHPQLPSIVARAYAGEPAEEGGEVLARGKAQGKRNIRNR
jgi:AcrR family transcriptional regulator